MIASDGTKSSVGRRRQQEKNAAEVGRALQDLKTSNHRGALTLYFWLRWDFSSDPMIKLRKLLIVANELVRSAAQRQDFSLAGA
jgi:hypothetical protein